MTHVKNPRATAEDVPSELGEDVHDISEPYKVKIFNT